MNTQKEDSKRVEEVMSGLAVVSDVKDAGKVGGNKSTFNYSKINNNIK